MQLTGSVNTADEAARAKQTPTPEGATDNSPGRKPGVG
jgi:hypothetical protein